MEFVWSKSGRVSERYRRDVKRGWVSRFSILFEVSSLL
jgi:hypothetical protein